MIFLWFYIGIYNVPDGGCSLVAIILSDRTSKFGASMGPLVFPLFLWNYTCRKRYHRSESVPRNHRFFRRLRNHENWFSSEILVGWIADWWELFNIFVKKIFMRAKMFRNSIFNLQWDDHRVQQDWKFSTRIEVLALHKSVDIKD